MFWKEHFIFFKKRKKSNREEENKTIQLFPENIFSNVQTGTMYMNATTCFYFCALWTLLRKQRVRYRGKKKKSIICHVETKVFLKKNLFPFHSVTSKMSYTCTFWDCITDREIRENGWAYWICSEASWILKCLSV